MQPTDTAPPVPDNKAADELIANVLASSPVWEAQFFTYAHLPARLANVSRPFAHLAADLIINLPGNPERDVAVRKLLEAKDAAVRAAVVAVPKPTT